MADSPQVESPRVVTVDDRREFVLSQIKDASAVERWEHLIPFDSPSEWRDYLSRGVRNGEFTVCEMIHRGIKSGVMVYKVEESAARELCVVAVYGMNPDCDYLESLDDAAQVLARMFNCVSIRFHTLRPGLVRRSLNLGYRIAEVVLRKNV